MNINRNNYEEYFLLYADNELSKTERKIVEIFVQENPDLKEEFSMLKLTINIPDENVKLTDKSFLLKKESLSFINENNCEEIFILYHDEELTEEQKTETKKFVTENPKYKADFEWIGKAKLIPDNSIVFPNKKHLCRKEKPGKVISLMYWISIAAAVFIGFGLWFVYYYNNQNNTPPSVALGTNHSIKVPAKNDTNIISEKKFKEERDFAASTEKIKKGEIKKNEEEIAKPVLKTQKSANSTIAKNNATIKKSLVSTKIKGPDIDSQITAVNKPIKSVPVLVGNNSNRLLTETVQHITKIRPETMEAMHAQTVSYLADAVTSNQNYVFYDVPAEEFKRSKVGGFLKKMSRLVERNNPIKRLFGGDEEQVAAK
jgi:cytoskeletal protein RodZ